MKQISTSVGPMGGDERRKNRTGGREVRQNTGYYGTVLSRRGMINCDHRRRKTRQTGSHDGRETFCGMGNWGDTDGSYLYFFARERRERTVPRVGRYREARARGKGRGAEREKGREVRVMDIEYIETRDCVSGRH